MTNYFGIVLILIIVGLGLWIWYLLKIKKEKETEILVLEKEKNEYEKLGSGIAEYNRKLQEKKKQAEEQVLEMFKIKSEISNREAGEKLGVSRATIARYFDALEKQGKVKQIGKTGQNVVYKATE